MAAVAANTKNYYIGPQDGWVEIVTGAVTPINYLRISAIPHTKPFFVFAGASPPSAATIGIQVCHHEFCMHDDTNGVSSLFYVRLTNPTQDSRNHDGRTRIDVYSEGGVLQ